MSAPRIYLDSNVFISAYENTGARSDHAWWILHAIERGDFAGITSEITLAEILVKPMEDGDDDLVRRYQEILSPDERFEVTAVSRQVLIEAARFRTMRSSLKLPDAIHVASAHLSHCSHVVSDDRRLPFAHGIPLIRLGPHSLNQIKAGPL